MGFKKRKKGIWSEKNGKYIQYISKLKIVFGKWVFDPRQSAPTILIYQVGLIFFRALTSILTKYQKTYQVSVY